IVGSRAIWSATLRSIIRTVTGLSSGSGEPNREVLPSGVMIVSSPLLMSPGSILSSSRMAAHNSRVSGERNSVTEAVLARRSVRAFLPRPVERAEVEELLELPARAPSGGNLQPWFVDVLAGEPLEALKAEVRS